MLLAAPALPALAWAPAPWYAAPYRELLVQRLDGEQVRAAFTRDGRSLDVGGYVQLCAAFRDAHVDPKEGIVQIAPALLQLFWELQVSLGVHYGLRPIVVHSGYRTLATNAATEGAVKNSEHCAGAAADVHVPGVPLTVVAQTLRRSPLVGGVGTYLRGSVDGTAGGWVHGDVGPPGREWTG